MIRKQQTDEAHGHVGEAVQDQPHAQEAGQEARPEHQHPEGEQPEAPEGLVDDVSLAMHAKEQHGEGVPLRLVEYREEFAATEQGEGGDIARHIHETDSGGDQD